MIWTDFHFIILEDAKAKQIPGYIESLHINWRLVHIFCKTSRFQQETLHHIWKCSRMSSLLTNNFPNFNETVIHQQSVGPGAGGPELEP